MPSVITMQHWAPQQKGGMTYGTAHAGTQKQKKLDQQIKATFELHRQRQKQLHEEHRKLDQQLTQTTKELRRKADSIERGVPQGHWQHRPAECTRMGQHRLLLCVQYTTQIMPPHVRHRRRPPHKQALEFNKHHKQADPRQEPQTNMFSTQLRFLTTLLKHACSIQLRQLPVINCLDGQKSAGAPGVYWLVSASPVVPCSVTSGCGGRVWST